MLVAALAISIFALVGFLVGQASRTRSQAAGRVRASAELSSYRRAHELAFRVAWQAAYRAGWKRGTLAGSRDGSSAADSLLARRAAAARARRRAAQAALATTVSVRGARTDRCVEVGGGLCEVLGPGATGKPCPTGSIPEARGGLLCIPTSLIRAAGGSGQLTQVP
jgi:hypothetical protein